MKRKRNMIRQTDLQFRRFCHRLTMKQRKAVLWILFVPFAAACVYTMYRPFMGSKNRESGMEFMEKDSLRMEFIQSIVRNGERKSQESNGTADETVQASVLKGQEAAE